MIPGPNPGQSRRGKAQAVSSSANAAANTQKASIVTHETVTRFLRSRCETAIRALAILVIRKTKTKFAEENPT